MSLYGTFQFIQDAVASPLNNDEYYLCEMLAQYQKRRDLVCLRLVQISKITYLTPKSGIFVLINISTFFQDDIVLPQKLLDTEKLSVSPGCAFGACKN